MKPALAFLTLLITSLFLNAGPGEEGRPAVIPRLEEWGLNENHPNPNDLAKYGRLIIHELDGTKTELRTLWSEKPVLLVHSSLTCPVSRDNCPHVDRIRQNFGDKINVVVIYTTEAHPVGSPSPYSEGANQEWITDRNLIEKILVNEPDSLSARLTRAREYHKQLGITSRLVVDNLSNQVWKLFGAGPNTATFISKEGKIIARQGWLKPSLMAGQIRRYFTVRNRVIITEKMQSKGIAGIKTRNIKANEISKDVQKAPELLEYSVNTRGGDRSLLHFAIDDQNIEVVDRLLKLGASPKTQDKDGATPLHYALQSSQENTSLKHRAIIKLLLESEKAPRTKSDRLETATHFAVYSDKLSHLKLALEAGCPLDQYTIDGISPLHPALYQSNETIAKHLISKGASIDLFAAAGLGYLKIVKRFITVKPHGWNSFQGDSGRSPLIYAAINGKTDVVKFLLSQQNKETRYSNEQLIACLKKANANNHVEASLAIAALAFPLKGDKAPAPTQSLVPQVPQITGHYLRDDPIIHEAASSNNTALIALLLDRGWDVNSLNPDEVTPLHYAAQDGAPEAIHLLIERGVNLEAKSGEPRPAPCGPIGAQKKNRTPLHYAVMFQQVTAVEVLMNHNANLEYNDIEGMTALAHALPSHYYNEDPEAELAKLKKIVRILIKAGADPDKPTESGKSFRELASEPVEKNKKIGGEWQDIGKLPCSPELLAFLKEIENE